MEDSRDNTPAQGAGFSRSRSEHETPVLEGHTPNPVLIELDAARAAAKTDAEHDRFLHQMLAIPAQNPADVAVKLRWIVGGNIMEAEKNCPFVATYESVGRDLGIPPGEISRHIEFPHSPDAPLVAAARRANRIGAGWKIRRPGEFVIGKLTAVAAAVALVATTSAATIGIASLTTDKTGTEITEIALPPDLDARLANIEAQLTYMARAPRDNYGLGGFDLPPVGTEGNQ